ncbi:Crp/Fnr family transcriptional regulator [Neoroseomonas soli]|uniref:Helix-turn-helix domain-containing protein n=1 Tax=Neoroseomonas soli TaxID=1081025 RepID=A0A9X9X0J5_9PROT|nr:helix-turn-helix domain-containing protein [Neoroseomonas soli]MBR0672924.1 helix-turn-helix domain-containing protein [Neoroseomonas soli]
MQAMRTAPGVRETGALLAAASAETRARLIETARPVALSRGAQVFAQDTPAESLLVLLQGSVGLSTTEDGGVPTMVEILAPGDAFSIPAVMLQLPNPVAAVALAPSRLIALPAEEVRAAAAADPGLMHAAMEQLARHWRLMLDQVVDLKTRDATQRAARFLVRRLVAQRGAVELPEPRAAIAARLGMTPESLSRALHGLEAAGLLRLHGRRVDVPDRAALLRATLPRTEARVRPA